MQPRFINAASSINTPLDHPPQPAGHHQGRVPAAHGDSGTGAARRAQRARRAGESAERWLGLAGRSARFAGRSACVAVFGRRQAACCVSWAAQRAAYWSGQDAVFRRRQDICLFCYQSARCICSRRPPSSAILCHLQGIAKTGSGKTAAFVLPMLVHIMDQPELQASAFCASACCCPCWFPVLPVQLALAARTVPGRRSPRCTTP